ncbi:MAG: alpha/beta fold hydrolase [Blastocatellia bacterium]
MKLRILPLTLLCLLFCCGAIAFAADDLETRAEHGYADSKGVKIHYAALGKNTAPLIIMIHGFPDFWYSWRDQMEALSKDYYAVAIDQRGYNLSDKPKGIENYDMQFLVGDVAAVIKHLKRDKAVIVGHDWGGAVAWTFAMMMPQMTEKLIILNLPHPKGLSRELANNPEQQKNSQYARNFQMEGAHTKLSAEGLAFWVKDPAAKKKYVEAFRRSDFEAMLAYYKRNYPREPYTTKSNFPDIKVKASVLMIHGLGDTALLPGALNDTWNWLEKDLTLVTVPGSGHFVQHDASEMVTRSIRMWLGR